MRRLAAVVITVLLLTGCRGREPDELALVRVLGVDGRGPVTLTAVCGGDGQGDGSRGSCAGADFLSALDALPWADEGGRQELALTSVSYLIVGRDADLENVLLAVLRDQELAGLSTVWLADKGAAALLEASEDPAAALALLDRRGVEAPTAARALASLYHDGRVELPVLDVGQKGMECRGVESWR